MALKRIQREYQDLITNPKDGISIRPLSDDNLFKWTGTIAGPVGTPYEGGVFGFDLDLTTDYPFKPPKVKLTTKIYHCNIDDDGSICMGVLKADGWKPSTKIADVLLTLQNLIAEPNPDDPLSAHKAEQYRSDRASYDKEAKRYTAQYAQPKAESK
ncbi:ubiquitin-conjugating enzyme 2 [Catenaria anguillulae PL171]|uniref:E2 ubiquitin-conjugating enzyme n=1 Tax=Catenaria anguillulae PL171 TaxID=765915 RepID=A0A1Y2HTW3_9FUNG|nr:ubiquitin-conjugating enzyme 2 [Catenaria anguillulae PL171]